MATITWDAVGSRRFETGVSNGVLYLPDGTAVPWNGLTGITENENRTQKGYYLDGRKFLDVQTPGDFSATLKAFTYPDEFALINGDVAFLDGIILKDQPNQPFNLSYQTRTGNDADLDASGYLIHILFQIQALPSDKDYETLGESLTPLEFSWDLSSTPSLVSGRRPTAHVVIDPTKTQPDVIVEIEKLLYGDSDTNPSLTTLQDFLTQVEAVTTIIITDNGDGTWSATGPDEYFSVPAPDEFEIDDVNETDIDADTYSVTDTIINP
jgi:hypothetical protein